MSSTYEKDWAMILVSKLSGKLNISVNGKLILH